MASKTGNQCMGCQAGWPRVERMSSMRPRDRSIGWWHPVPPPGYRYEHVFCTRDLYEAP